MIYVFDGESGNREFQTSVQPQNQTCDPSALKQPDELQNTCVIKHRVEDEVTDQQQSRRLKLVLSR